MTGRRFVYSVRMVRRVGRRHGRDWRWRPLLKKEAKQPQPPAEQAEPAEYEQELKAAAESQLGQVAEQWQKEDQRLYAEYVRAMREHKQAEESLKKEAAEADEAIREHAKARQVVADLGLPSISRRARNTWLVVLAILEFPINKAVFQIFQLNRMETALAAASVGVVIPLLAHLTGYFLRQDVKNARDKTLLWVAPFAGLTVIGAIAYIRSTYLEAENRLDVLGVHINPATMTVIFIVVNMSIFITALITSYHGSHPRGKLFRQASKRLKAATRSLRKETGEAQVARHRFEAAAKAADLARSRRQKRFELLAEEARSVIQRYEHLVRVYRGANLEARRASGRPQCFSVEPVSAVLPAVFQKLNWNAGRPAGAGKTP